MAGTGAQANANNNKKVVDTGIELVKVLLTMDPQQRSTPEKFVQNHIGVYTLTRYGSLHRF
jgi:hypothetical protein